MRMLENIKIRSHNEHAGNANCHNLDAGYTMVRAPLPPQLGPAMIRSASVFFVVVASALGAVPALAQDSSELVTRIERLEGTIRTLTGTIEELQYRNQQLEQQVQRVGAGTPPAAAAPQRPAAQLPPPAAVGPPAGGRRCSRAVASAGRVPRHRDAAWRRVRSGDEPQRA